MKNTLEEMAIQAAKEWKETQLTNQALIRGTIVKGPIKITAKKNNFYRVELEIARKSEQKDRIPAIIDEALVEESMLFVGKQVEIEGEYHSRYVNGEDGRRHLDLFVYANCISFVEGEPKESQNVILLEGYTTKEVHMRITPFGRIISDMILSVHCKKGRTYYIPCIAWGYLAKEIAEKPAGTKVKLMGRVQSREYVKRYYDLRKKDQTKVAYEISIMQMQI